MSSSSSASVVPREVSGAIVVVAKCPIPGKSKTRLAPLLGQEGSAKLARAMLSDVLCTLHHCAALDNKKNSVPKILLYAPGNNDGLEQMQSLMQTLHLPTSQNATINDNRHHWTLLPIMASQDLKATDLGALLENALERVRKDFIVGNAENVSAGQPLLQHGSVIFLGMDSPVLPLTDIEAALKDPKTAVLCPADDGGYGMLSVPHAAPLTTVFRGVHWSHPLTAVSQCKALTDQGMTVKMGQLMHDIDEPEDVHRLVERLNRKNNNNGNDGNETNDKILAFPSGNTGSTSNNVTSMHPTCHYTRQALAELQDRLKTF